MVAQSSFDPGPFGPFLNPLQAYFDGLESLSQGLGPLNGPLKGAARCQLEMMGFLSRRAQASLESASRLSQSQTPQDVINEQFDFWRTAFEQYAESSSRIMDAWFEMASLPQGAGAQSARGDHDYITFPTAKDAEGGAGRQSARERRRRVA
jgi:hypothetical protein